MSKKEERRRRELMRLQKAIERQRAESAREEEEERTEPEEEKRAETEEEESAWEPEPTPPQGSPDWDHIWGAFDAAGLEGKEALFREVLASGEMEADAAIEMLADIRGLLDTREPQGRARYAGLVEMLREQAPDLYRERVSSYHRNLIHDAVTAGQWDDVPQLLEPFVEDPASDLDTFSEVIDQLCYHGRVQLLVSVMARAWAKVRDSDEVLEWAVEEFAGKLVEVHLFHYLETTDDPHADDPKLLERIAAYGEWEDVWRERTVAHLTASQPSDWKMTDFGPAVDADQWHENLSALLLEFLADRHRAGVPYGRGGMARTQLVEILKRQLALPAEPFGIASEGQAGGKRRGRRELTIPAPLPLVPRNRLVDEALVDLFPIFGAQPYHAAALMELLPSYLHFLARLGLIHPVQMDAALQELRPLSQPVLRMIRAYGGDICAVEAVQAAWSDGTLAALQEDPALAGARETPPEPIPEPGKPTARPGATLTYTFRVTYLRDPDVWRTIETAANQTLHALHYAIQDAVDFDIDHLYSFFMSNQAWDDGTAYNSPYTDGPSASSVKIEELDLRMKQRFLYLFDYGDEHRFEVQLIDVNPEAPRDESYPRILERHGEDPEQYQW
jgi:hypothetical protein